MRMYATKKHMLKLLNIAHSDSSTMDIDAWAIRVALYTTNDIIYTNRQNFIVYFVYFINAWASTLSGII